MTPWFWTSSLQNYEKIHFWCYKSPRLRKEINTCWFSFFLPFQLLNLWVIIFNVCRACAVFPGSSAGKESPCNAGNPGSIPGSGRSPGEGNGYPLQYSCLENPMDHRSLVGYSPWGGKESDMTERLSTWTECLCRAPLVAQMAKNLPAVQETWVRSLGQEDPRKKGMEPTPVFLSMENPMDKFHGQRSLAGCSPWCYKE